MKTSIRAFALLFTMACATLVSIACSDSDDGVSPQSVTPAATDSTELPDTSSSVIDSVEQVEDSTDLLPTGPFCEVVPDTEHYTYISFVMKDVDRYDTITGREENVKCDVSENDLQCDVTSQSGLCVFVISTHLGTVVVNDTVKLNYGDNPQTSFIPNKYTSEPPTFNVETARDATDSLKALCGSVTPEFEAKSAEAKGLPEYMSLSAESEGFCWSSKQYTVDSSATDKVYTVSACDDGENEGVPDTSITEFSTCSFSPRRVVYFGCGCTIVETHYPEDVPDMKKYHLTFASAAPMDTTINWVLNVTDYAGYTKRYDMTTRLVSAN